MKIKTSYIVMLLNFLLMPSVIHFFSSGFMQGDDGEWMVIRFSAFYQAFADGQIPVRFLHRLNFGFGYPVANFLYPGFMYLGVPIKLLGFEFVETVKILFGISMVLSGIFTFYWLRKLFGNISAFFASIYYVYTPYHIFDLYARGSLGEMMSLAVAPFVFWQIERKSFVFIAIGIALLIMSHNTLAVMFLALIFAYMSVNIYLSKEKITALKIYTISIIAGLGLSAFFAIPAILELRYVVFSDTIVSEWNRYFASYALIGVVAIALVLLVAFALFVKKRYLKHRLTVLMLIAAVLSIFLSISFSSFIWEWLPVTFVQFPFRFLSVAILSTAFLFAFLLHTIKGKTKFAIGVLFIILTLVFSLSYLSNPLLVDKGEGFYATNESTTTVKDEYMPRWVKQFPTSHFGEKVEIITGEGSVEDIYYDNKRISFNLYSIEKTLVRVNTIYYPGWEAKANDDEVVINYENDLGVMDLYFPPGDYLVDLTFNETPLRQFSNGISLISFFGILIYSGVNLTRNRKDII